MDDQADCMDDLDPESLCSGSPGERERTGQTLSRPSSSGAAPRQRR